MKHCWRKLGQIYCPSGQKEWMYSHAAVPIAEHIEGDVFKIYFSSRNKDNQSFAYPKFKNVVEYRQSDKSFNFINNLSMNYYQFNAKKEINWKIVNDKKKIGNFEVIRATTNYGGRNWTAWYCSEISLPYGPYVFYGLPGLILEIYDDEYNFHFSFFEYPQYHIIFVYLLKIK